MRTVLVAATFILSLALAVEVAALTCGKTESLYTTAKSCTCPADLHSSTWKKRFKIRNLDIAEQCQMAANGAKFFCSTKGRVIGFQHKVLEKKYTKTATGRFEGHCKVKYQCKWKAIKHSRLIKAWQPFPRIRNGKGSSVGHEKVLRKDYRTKTPDHKALLNKACQQGRRRIIKRLRDREYRKVRSFQLKMTKKDISDWDTYYYINCYFDYTYTYWPLARKHTYIYWCANK